MADVGRPTKYDPKYCKEAFNLALLGATDKELADSFDVEISTINKWKLDYPEFSESLKKGKITADGKIARSLYNRAKGYKYQDQEIIRMKDTTQIIDVVKTMHGDVTAQAIWLNNRRPKNWRRQPAENITTLEIPSDLTQEVLSLISPEVLQQIVIKHEGKNGKTN